MKRSSARDWILCPRPSPRAKLRLLCFSSAGTGASSYRTWPDLFGEEIEVRAVQLPGREGRLLEAPFTHVEPLVDALLPHALPVLEGGSFAIFGHSLGALVAYRFARRLADARGPRPKHLFVSSRRAPHLPLLHPPLHTLDDEALTREIRRYNGTPEEVLANKELMELLLPGLRADFQIHETYAHDDAPPLDVPILATGGDRDPGVPEAGLDAWREHTSARFEARLFPGDHFYLNAHRGALVDAIRAALFHDG